MCHQPVGGGGKAGEIITGGERTVRELRDQFIGRAVCIDRDSLRSQKDKEERQVKSSKKRAEWPEVCPITSVKP